MNKEKLDKIISDTEDYMNKMQNLYSDKLYMENAMPNKSTPYFAEPIAEKKALKNPVRALSDKQAVAEIDLFGNETIKKEEWEFAESIEELNEKIKDCKKCDLWKTRTNFVFGVGNPKADIVVIGEAPGADEDMQGEPFVGRAGQLLNKILSATGFQREEVFICNILKSRPPGNRNPLQEEVDLCKPYLDKQLKLINPKLILLLGKVAAESLLKTREPLNKIRGKVHEYKGWKVMVTFHPAALLRNPNWKPPCWEDMKQFKKMYEEILSSRSQ